ncbi:MAG: mycothiol system anti-sigma-R factor [Streptosporangiaceae bacterium]
MSCGRPHEVDCRDVLARVYIYLDGELDETDCAKVRQHLDECAPCLQEFGLEEEVKKLVHRHCGRDPVPGGLRAKVLDRIQQVAGSRLPAD